ncbi:hypothetical protein HY229_03390 [Candidatus Acetothermia bacterium]|nr:hypothetical protein [Candidatus Acetothermia bacterium]MBI3643127.1 hypothetical protein [Candidatus Acetothermia bacterium]
MKKLFTFAGLAVLTVALALVTGSAASVTSYLDDISPAVRSAASDVVSQQCNNGTIKVSYSRNGVFGANTAEGRRAGLQCQVKAMVSGPADPFIGKTSTAAANAQLYANLAVASKAPSVSLERRWARAQAAVTGILTGFAIVPGGPAEAFNRIQTCLAGAIVTNQGNKAAGVALNCGEETVRRAVADLVATGFYLQFGHLVSFGCDGYLDQAQNGATVEARWAASRAYVAGCAPDLNSLVADSSHAELSFAAVADLAQGGGTSASGANADVANAWAAGLAAADGVTVDSAGNPTTSATGNLFKYATKNFGTTKALTAIAPLARYFYGSGELHLTINQNVPGANLPLVGGVVLN